MTEPEITPIAPAAAPEAPPPVPATEPQETGADPVPTPEASELSTFRAARKAEREGEVADDFAPVAQADGDASPPEVTADADEDATAEAAAPTPGDPTQLVDPDTGDVLDHKKRSGRRIMSLLRKQHELKAQIEALHNQIETPQPTGDPAAEPEAAQATPVPGDPAAANDPAPVLAQFSEEADPYASWIAANSRWEARQEYHKQSSAQAQQVQATNFEAAVTQAQKQWDAKSNDPEFKKIHPDFDEKYNIVYTSLPTDGKQRPLVGTLLKSPIGHEIMHYLGTHPEKIAELYQQPTLAAHQRMIGKLEAQVEATLTASQLPASTSVATTTPSAPMAPVGGTATPTSYDSRSASLSQFRKHHGVRGGRRRS